MAKGKATKKFEKNKLSDTLKRRKEFAKVKQRHQITAKRKAKRAAEEDTNGDANGTIQPEKQDHRPKDGFGDMTVDDFFSSGFEIPKDSKASKARKRSGKRKRTEEENGEDSEASVASVEEHAEADSDVENETSQAEVGGDEMTAHQDELKAMADKDPEFYKYLRENDPELLDFAEDANLAEIDELSGSEGEGTDKHTKKSKKGESNDVSKALIQRWNTAMSEKNSLRAMREVVLAFRAAAHLNEEKEFKYIISNADVYHELLLCALRQIPEVLNHHIPVKEAANGKVRVSTDNKKFRNMTTLLKSHALSIQHLIANLSDPGTIKITLTSVLALLPYLLSFKKLIRDMIRTVVDIWSDSAQVESTRISAFLVIRRLAIIGDAGIKETVLRTAYQGLIKGSRNTTVHNIGGHNLMKNSAAELWGLADANIAYTTGFTFIRQLAIHLRNSIKNNANDSYKTVYNWQYVHSLDFWSRVLSTHCESLHEASIGKESALRPLIYPLTQVTLGAMRLIPTAAYFPLRFHMVRSLLRMSQATNTYIPLATPLYEVLLSAEMKKAPKPSTMKPLDFETNIRAAKSFLRTRTYQDGVGEQTVELLSEFFTLWCKSIAFPELALPVVVMLKRWLKEVSPHSNNAHQANGKGGAHGKNKRKPDTGSGGNRNGKLNTSVSLLISKLDANARWIEERRAKVDYAPKDRAGVELFLKETEWAKTPLGAFVEGQRKMREEKKRMMEEARRAEERKRADERREKEQAMDEAESGSEEEEEEEEMEDEDEQEFEDEGGDEEMEEFGGSEDDE